MSAVRDDILRAWSDLTQLSLVDAFHREAPTQDSNGSNISVTIAASPARSEKNTKDIRKKLKSCCQTHQFCCTYDGGV